MKESSGAGIRKLVITKAAMEADRSLTVEYGLLNSDGVIVGSGIIMPPLDRETAKAVQEFLSNIEGKVAATVFGEDVEDPGGSTTGGREVIEEIPDSLLS